MSKFKTGEIIKLLDTLIGETSAVGDTNADKQILENLNVLVEVTDWCLDSLQYAKKTKDSYEFSAREIGRTAQRVLQEYMDWLREEAEEEQRRT